MHPTELTHALIVVPNSVCSSFSAIAPAATRPIVSLADALPPPLAARIPYFQDQKKYMFIQLESK